MSVSGARAAPTLHLIESQGEQGINKVQYGLVRDLVSWRLGYTSWTMPQVSPVCSKHTCHHCNLSSNQADNMRKHMKKHHYKLRIAFPWFLLSFLLSTFVCRYLNILLIPACVPGSSICRGRTGGGRCWETGKLYHGHQLHHLELWLFCCTEENCTDSLLQL